MRFQDWDVLLFPGESQTPIQEFRTTCFSLQDPRTHLTTPLLCSFVPSLPANAPFQVSVHSWSKPPWILGDGNAGYVPGTKYLWQVKIVSDGHVLHKQDYPEDTNWPLQIGTSTPSASDEKPSALPFPPFHKETTSQTQWYAAEDRGRVKISLSAGYTVESSGKSHFVKLVDHVVFSFQPAPLDLLQRSGIAWPNAHLPTVSNPLLQAHLPPLTVPLESFNFNHKRQQSLGGLPEWMPSHHDGSSRSTSAYTSYATYPPLEPFGPSAAPPYPASHRETVSPRVDVRMHSDQLRQLIEALSPSKQSATAASTSMPPPPLPLHLTNQQQRPTTLPPPSAMDRRAESRYSDISMHAGCTGFPTCTTEDAEGCIVHSNASTTLPAGIVKGRKEGSSPNKSTGRDFMSTVMDQTSTSSPVEEGSARKRTRSALKSLSINDGSPEKKEKPPRKLSRASVASATESDKENMMVE